MTTDLKNSGLADWRRSPVAEPVEAPLPHKVSCGQHKCQCVTLNAVKGLGGPQRDVSLRSLAECPVDNMTPKVAPCSLGALRGEGIVNSLIVPSQGPLPNLWAFAARLNPRGTGLMVGISLLN